MEKVNQILMNIQSTIQYIVDAAIGLCFQPLYVILAIIQALIEIWSGDENEDVSEDVNEGVKVYPSTNEGRYPDEVELPVCNHIGFKINRAEQDEIKRIKEELNK